MLDASTGWETSGWREQLSRKGSGGAAPQQAQREPAAKSWQPRGQNAFWSAFNPVKPAVNCLAAFNYLN